MRTLAFWLLAIVVLSLLLETEALKLKKKYRQAKEKKSRQAKKQRADHDAAIAEIDDDFNDDRARKQKVDPHANHRPQQPAVDPHANHRPQQPAVDPHAHHRGGNKPSAVDPHANHRPQQPAAQHRPQQQPAVDPHAHHRMPPAAPAHHVPVPVQVPVPQQQPHHGAPNRNTLSQVRSAMNADGMHCKDSLGNTLQWNAGRPDLFKLVIGPIAGSSSDYQVVTAACAHGSFFDIRTCSCEIAPEDPIDKDQCHIYLPFNDNLVDHSIQRFATLIEGVGSVTIDKSSAAVSSGSARFTNARLDIPGRLKTTTRMEFSSSWCTFFRCENTPNSFNCIDNGGIIANRPDSRHVSLQGVDSTFSLGVVGSNKIVAKLVYGDQPSDVVVLESKIEPSNSHNNGFVHVCVTHDSMMDKMYVNKNIVASKPSQGKLLPVSGPYTIGHAKSLDYFRGLIDEVLICDHTMQPEEVVAHHDGNKVFLSTRGLIPAPPARF